jgi:hypothetical protein
VSSTDPTDLDGGSLPDDHGAGRPGPARQVSWTNRLIIAFVVLVALVAGWFIGTALLPRWWARRVADVADGSMVAGIFAGVVCGLVFTAVPLALLRLVIRRHARWGVRLVALVAAALAAIPNLVTLGIVSGTGNAAHDADLMLLGAPGFPGASAVGALLALVVMVVLWVAVAGRRRRRNELHRLRSELRRREAAELDRTADRDDDHDDQDGPIRP